MIDPRNDTRNVVDKYKGLPHDYIVADLDVHGTALEIAIENLQHDFNIGSIVRSANAFGVRHVYIIGKRQWNKRGAMVTDKYLHVHHCPTVEDFRARMHERGRAIIAIDNVPGSIDLGSTALPQNAILVFGQEGPGISPELSALASQTVAIEQFGSTRSLNVGVAAGIAMYAWVQQNVLH